MPDNSSDEEVFISAYPRLLVEGYCIIASSALLWFDFCLTFTTEVRRIWRRRSTGATIVYLFMRYTALLDRLLFASAVLLWDLSDETCGRVERADDVMVLLNYFAISAFTALRVYAVGGQDWKPMLIVVPLTLTRPVLQLYEMTHYIPLQGGAPLGCFIGWTVPTSLISDCKNLTTIAQVTTIAAESILIGLTWAKTFTIIRESMDLGVRTPVATLLFRDGTAYFIVLLSFDIVTLITINQGAQLNVWMVWPLFSQVFTVIFLSRFLLNLRGLYLADRGPRIHDGAITSAGTESTFSAIRFDISRVVGNMGATLSYPERTEPHVDSVLLDRRHDDDIESLRDNDNVASIWSANEINGWYEDEEPMFSSDPFREGLCPVPVVVDVQMAEEPINQDESQITHP